MGKKAIDSRIPTLIRNGYQTKTRSFIIIVGDRAKDQLPNLHYLLSSVDVKATRSVLWAYKTELLGFTSHRKKREKKIKREIKRGTREVNQEDPFELFLTVQNIRYVYYKETDKILGNTYGMCILQDFEAMTPNILARTIETVEGGGLIVLMLRSMNSLKQLYSLSMDVHSRYRTEAHGDIVGRFNERFILSLGNNPNCLVVDDELNVLPISGARNVKALPYAEPVTKVSEELQDLKEKLKDTQPVGSIVSVAKTLDQANAVLTFVEAITEKTLRATVSLTAARGRGKSAAMGLAIAAAVAHGYSNIFITSPSPENLKTLFQFVFKGFDALGYQEHLDYDILQSNHAAFNKAIVRVNITKSHRQTIQYIQPSDAHVLGQAELLVIDEAAAIPLPIVQKLLGNYLIFMASTINGYEGTGRSLSLKLLQQLRQQSAGRSSSDSTSSVSARSLREITLEEPIRYAPGDPVEKWLNDLLCLDVATPTKGLRAIAQPTKYPHPDDCQLFYINRDTLFSYHAVSEAFLRKMMTLYVSSHYKNTPNDLQLMSDAPAHQLYALIPPVDEGSGKLPEPLCVIQIALEGKISKKSVMSALSKGQRGGGDLIPWLVSQQFQDSEFATLSGARIVRIATHPDYMNMGYGSRAIRLLIDYFEGKFTPLDESLSISESDEYSLKRVTDADISSNTLHDKDDVKVRDSKVLPPLLLKLTEKKPNLLHYIGVSFGMTTELFKFWKRLEFVPVYLRQTPNELTGEHSSVVLRALGSSRSSSWLPEFAKDFHRRFLSLLSYDFSKFTAIQGLAVIETVPKFDVQTISKEQLDFVLSPFDMKRLESYANNLLDYHVIVDLLPLLAQLYFTGRFGPDVSLSGVQQAILLGTGLQRKALDTLSKELGLPHNQVIAMFAKTVRKATGFLQTVIAKAIEAEMPAPFTQKQIEGATEDLEDDTMGLRPMEMTIEEDLYEASSEVKSALREKQRALIDSLDLSQYEIGGDDDEWNAAEKGAKNVASKGQGVLSVKTGSKTAADSKRKAHEIYTQEMAAVEKLKKKSKKGKK
ncbi:hypothetical protein CANCADRAFT_971 [Tortispora caseinolytica NRRL Y-17796]|uniref:RNA cytidine acetyltransferase n=1 Tax=Tortispora caseinolytica NRRL Y-17796 TaxID=767744 RepID=A0A1E4TKV1_9ASCO|nr:hypothetical protein CANCADRAFT_971 [Tortispora caseinolytica NRRL Y-17796]